MKTLIACLFIATGLSTMAQDNDIVDTAIAAENFTTLVTAVQAAGLEDALRGEGPFTVLAPTDDAFAELPEGTLAFLLANPDELQRVLLYHVVSGQALAETVVTLDSATTLSGDDITISTVDGQLSINNAQVIATDILATNGVIHVIDKVLLPPAKELDLLDTAIAAGNFTTLVAAVQAAGLEDALRGGGPITVFAPTDDAFAKVPAETLDFLLANPGELQKVLLYHTIAGAVLAETVVTLDSATTLLGEDVTISVVDGQVKVNNATVIATDIVTSNGVIHVIDEVLLPPTEEQLDIVDTAIAAGRFTTLVTALQLTGLDEALRGEGPFTVFAPTDEAFAKLPAEDLADLIADPAALTDILLFHVVSGNFMAPDVLSRNQLLTLQGSRAGITQSEDGVYIEDAQVIAADIAASNGTIHVIDSVIVPRPREGYAYEVTLINGTTNQVFTPPLLISHKPSFTPFEVGEPASSGLAALAQEGDTEGMIDELFPLGDVLDMVAASEPILPGQRATYTLYTKGSINNISVLGMLATSNDTFFSTTVTAPRVLSFKNSVSGTMVSTNVNAYDAGSEYNSESCAHIPGPPCANPGGSPDQAGEGFVSFAKGISGVGDLASATYDWRGPVAILRVQITY